MGWFLFVCGFVVVVFVCLFVCFVVVVVGFFLLSARFASKCKGRGLISLECSALYCLCHLAVSTKKGSLAWQIMLFQQLIKWRPAASKVLAPHPVTKVQCI